MTLEFGNHVIGQMELSWLQPGKVRDATIVGSERSAVVDCVNQLIRIHENGDKESFSLPVESNNTILDEVKNFAETIQGKENHKNPGQIGAGNVTVLEKLKESLERERTVKVDLREPE
jgi:predicted dehydrogenase